jgi:hypothetical protein
MKRRALCVFVLTIAITLLALGTAGAAYTWHTYGGHNYALTGSQQPWIANEAEAVQAGGHLVTINDAAENAWLTSTFANTYCVGYEGNPWGAAADIGYYWDGAAWSWISGEGVTYTNLYSSFPGGGSHSYLHVDNHPSAGTWNANPVHTEPGQPLPMYGIIEVVPEPSGLLALASGLMGIAGVIRRRIT